MERVTSEDQVSQTANPFSFDRRGTLLIEGERVHRRVVPELRLSLEMLQASGTAKELFDAGLIEWKFLPGESSVVEHPFLQFVSYPQEWTFEMLRMAAVVVLDVAIILQRSNLTIQDPHPWNVTFSKGRPVFVDVSSIFPGPQFHPRFIHDFFKGFYLPLWLRSHRLSAPVAEAVLQSEHEWRNFCQPRIEWRRLFDRRRAGRMCTRFWCIVDRCGDSPLKLLTTLREHIPSMRLWVDSRQSFSDADEQLSPTEMAAVGLLERLPKGRLLDLACGVGHFAGHAATKLGHRVCGIDRREVAINAALARAARDGFDVARMNVAWPTPPQGAFLMYPSAYERFRADTVAILGSQHDLVLRRNISFDAIPGMAIRYGARRILVEWIPAEDSVVRRWLQSGTVKGIPDWYREERFVAAIATHYPDVTSVEPVYGRKVFLFQR